MTRTTLTTHKLGKAIEVPIADVEVFMSTDKYTSAFMSDGASHLISYPGQSTLKGLYAEFGPEGTGEFIEACRWLLVRVSAIKRFSTVRSESGNTYQEFITESGFRSTCSRRAWPNVKSAFEKYTESKQVAAK